MANTKITRAVKKAKALYKTGKYKTFADAVKSAYKKIGSTSSPKKKAAKPVKIYQRGSSNKKRDEERKAKAPGKRTSATGRQYTERRKNRSDMPGQMTGTVSGAKSFIAKWHKDMLAKALLKKELATTKRDRKQWATKASHLKKEIKKFS